MTTRSRYSFGKLTAAEIAAMTSAELRAIVSDETGTGALVFGTAPTFTTSITTPIIKPPTDSTTAVQITKADGSTQVIGVDTTNSRAIVGTGTSTADFAVKPNTDATVYLGRAAIGSAFTDYMTVAHYDLLNGTYYALLQSSTGDTSVNSGTGGTLFLRIGHSPKAVLNDTGLGVGTTSPWSKLSVDGGNISARNTATLGSEALSETDFATHAKWDVTGSCVDSGGNAAFTGAGTLTQTAGNMVGAVSLLPDCMYLLTYTVSNAATADGAATLTTGVAASAQTLSVAANGTAKTITFRSAAAPASFVINCTAGTFTLDDISCKPVQGGSVEAFGSVKTNSLTNFGGTSNIVIKPAGTGITVIGDAGSASYLTGANDNLFVSGQFEALGRSYYTDLATCFGGINVYNTLLLGETGGSFSATLGAKGLSQQITIAAGASTATTTTLSIPVRSTITGFVAKVTQAPGGGPTAFNCGISGNVDALIDNKAVTLNGTFDAWEDGDGTYTFFLPVPTSGGAMTFTVTTTDGSDTPVNVTGASFIIRLVAFYQTRTPPTS